MLRKFLRFGIRLSRSWRKKFRRIVSPYRFFFSTSRAPISTLEPGWVLARTACFGNDVINNLFPNTQVVRFQKGRVDRLSHLLFDGPKRPKPVRLSDRSYLARKDVWWFLAQLNQRLELRESPEPRAVIIDSYSDLTDQLFTSRDDSSRWFFANFADIRAEAINRRLEPGGLASRDSLRASWSDLISRLLTQWPTTQIVLLSYPTNLEKRPKFLERAEWIAEIWKDEVEKHAGVFQVPEVDSTIVTPLPKEESTGEIFPYHYHPEVAAEVAEIIRSQCFSSTDKGITTERS